MLHFRSLDVYRCAVAFLPKAYFVADELDSEMANQLRRAALSINLNIAMRPPRSGSPPQR